MAKPTIANGDPILNVSIRQTEPVRLDVGFECGANELLSLIGPSGSGKTTLLHIIAGLAPVAEGTITSGGQTWLSTKAKVCKPPQERGVGLVFQDYALFPHMSALDNVAIAIVPGDRKKAYTAAAELLERVHMTGLGARRPHELSGGERQRVAIARALARRPRVLLLDEPFSAVDRMTRRALRDDLMVLKKSLRIPVIFVTHDIGEALELADRVAVLDKGKILQTGDPQTVKTSPASDRVSAILGLN